MRILLPLLLAFSVSACTCEPRQSPPYPETELAKNKAFRLESAKSEKVQCPVCGLEFDKREAKAKYEFEAVEYYFLLQDHYLAFKSSPENYVGIMKDLDSTSKISDKTADGGSGRVQ